MRGPIPTCAAQNQKLAGITVSPPVSSTYARRQLAQDFGIAQNDRLIAEWLTAGRRLSHDVSELMVTELVAKWWRYAWSYYVKNDRPTVELAKIRAAMRPVKRLYGRMAAVEFGPLKLKTVRQAFIDRGLSRKHINDQIGRIKRMFKWGVENELVPTTVYHGLQAVSGLRRGRSEARETEPVRPVPEVYVDAIRQHVSRQVWAIIQVQRLTGMRSGEVVIMRGRDFDTSGLIWLFRPMSHKTEHHGYERIVEIGPRAQAVIEPFLKSDVGAYLFSPADAVAEQRAEKHAKRETPMSCGNKPGSNRKRKPKREPQDRYTPDSYRRAIARGCDKADLAAKEAKVLEADSERIIPRWHPHQLRHNYATRVRREFGLESARILLGHRSAVTTEIYAEADRMKARQIVAKIG